MNKLSQLVFVEIVSRNSIFFNQQFVAQHLPEGGWSVLIQREGRSRLVWFSEDECVEITF